MIFLTGPGHGGPALVANTWLEGSWSDTYPSVGRPTAKGFSAVPYTVGFVALDALPHVRLIGNVAKVRDDRVRQNSAHGRVTPSSSRAS